MHLDSIYFPTLFPIWADPLSFLLFPLSFLLCGPAHGLPLPFSPFLPTRGPPAVPQPTSRARPLPPSLSRSDTRGPPVRPFFLPPHRTRTRTRVRLDPALAPLQSAVGPHSQEPPPPLFKAPTPALAFLNPQPPPLPQTLAPEPPSPQRSGARCAVVSPLLAITCEPQELHHGVRKLPGLSNPLSPFSPCALTLAISPSRRSPPAAAYGPRGSFLTAQLGSSSRAQPPSLDPSLSLGREGIIAFSQRSSAARRRWTRHRRSTAAAPHGPCVPSRWI
jgi:hypothetical protein